MSAHVLVIVARRYNGHEFWVALGTLRKRGHKVTVASTDYNIEDEVTGRPNRIKLLVRDIEEIDEYDALMVVSGNMQDTEAHWHSPVTQRIVEQFHTAGKPIAAICCSVPTVRKAARGKKVSYFPLIRSRELLEASGAIPCSTSVTADGNLVTAEHQMATQMWVETFCDILENKAPKITLKPVAFDPGRRERRPVPELETLKEAVNKTGKKRIEK